MQPFLEISLSRAPIHKTEALSLINNDEYYELTNASGTVRAKLRKREAYPGTFCYQTSDSEWILGYGRQDTDDEPEFLEIQLFSSGSLSVKRDGHATLPIYYYATDDNGLFLSNEYSRVVQTCSPKLSLAGVCESIAVSHLTGRPLAEGVEFLAESEVLEFSGSDLQITRAPERTWVKSKDLPARDARDFLAIFDSYLDHFTETRLAGQSYAFEVSGGLDSATLPQYLASRGKKLNVPVVTMRYNDPGFAESQDIKLQAVLAKIGGEPLSATLDENLYPLKRFVGNFQPFYLESAYYESTEPLLRQLVEQGVKVVCTGHGGDEMFGNTPGIETYGYGEAERAFRRQQQLPDFLTNEFRDYYVNSTYDKPQHSYPRLSYSVSFGQLSNNIYIRHDIWPVSPFNSSVKLYEWVQGLPSRYRANRNILRAYHQAHGFVSEIYDMIQNEGFDRYWTGCYKAGKFDKLFKLCLDNSTTIAQGFVDKAKLVSAYDKAKNATSADDEEAGFRIYLWMIAEINAHQAQEGNSQNY